MRWLLPMLVCGVLGGCIPSTYTTVACISGRVLDRAGRPEPNVQVLIEREIEPGHSEIVSRLDTDAGGHFIQHATTQCGVYWIGQDIFGFAYRVTLQDQASHLSKTVPFSMEFRILGLGPPRLHDVGDLIDDR